MAFDRILVPLDGSQVSEESLTHALRFARAYKSRLYLLQILNVQGVPGARHPEESDWRLLKIQAQAYLSSLAERLAGEDMEIECRVQEGRPSDQIVEFARERRIDLIVMCAYGWGGASAFALGGSVQKIIAAPETSVMVIRPRRGEPEAKDHYGRVLVPLDGSQRAAWAVSLLSGMVHNRAPEIVLLQVVGLPEMPRMRPLTGEEEKLRHKFVECNRRVAVAYLEAIKKRFADTIPVRTRLEVSPHIVDTIDRVVEEENVDLIALTAHGASGTIERSSGSVCQSVVFSTSRPVLVLQDNPARYRQESKAPSSGWAERKIHAI
ncbi:MAG: universal stress protein [Gammaproteobacteria bacterium]|nr:universal stress protein [Gammaproteobacteria bacterium]